MTTLEKLKFMVRKEKDTDFPSADRSMDVRCSDGVFRHYDKVPGEALYQTVAKDEFWRVDAPRLIEALEWVDAQIHRERHESQPDVWRSAYRLALLEDFKTKLEGEK